MKPSAHSLRLELGEAELHFDTPTDFGFALSGRTSLPSTRLSALVCLSDQDLLKEVEGIRQVERRLVKVVSQSSGDAAGISTFLGELEPSLISQDNGWRLIIESLIGLGVEYEEYKKVGLVKYTQYLTSRQEVARTVYASRQPPGSTQAGGPSPSDQRVKDTDLFDLATLLPSEAERAELSRLPKGETIEISMASNQPVTIRLGKHDFRLLFNGEFHFVDQRGKDVNLHRGRKIIGRDATSDVPVDATYRTISRKHLIVEADGGNAIRLTDISSLGTFVSREYLDSTSV